MSLQTGLYYFENGEQKELSGLELDEQIKKLIETLKRILNKIEIINSEYQLNEVTANVELEAGVWVLKASGGLSFTWKHI